MSKRFGFLREVGIPWPRRVPVTREMDDSPRWRVRKSVVVRWKPRRDGFPARLEFPPYRQVCRRLFSRCAYCGGRFRWNETVHSIPWVRRSPGLVVRERALHLRCVHRWRRRTGAGKGEER